MTKSPRKTSSAVPQNKHEPAGGSLFERVFAFFFEPIDPEKQKRRLLRSCARELSRLKQRYYNPRNEMVLPGLPQFIYEIYKLLGPAQKLVKRTDSSKVLKNIVFEISLSDNQREILEGLQEETLRERAKSTDIQSLAEEAKQSLGHFFSSLTPELAEQIDASYNNLALFVDFIHFDYYFFLKKFSSRIVEHDFTQKPKFDSLSGEYVIGEMKDFYDLISGLDDKTKWDRIFEALKIYRKVDVIRRNIWEKAFRKLLDIRNTGVFELIIRHISKDPFYKSQPVVYNEKIVDRYLTALRAKTDTALRTIASEKKNKRIEDLAMAVFGTTAISEMKNYSEKTSTIFRKFGMPGFVYVDVMGYVSTFLVYYFKEDLSRLMDLLLIKGRWSSKNHSQQMSEGYHQLIRISEMILEFDQSLGEEEDLGRKLRNLFYRAEGNKRLLPVISQELMQVNDQAKSLLIDTAKELIKLGKCIKQIHDDYATRPHEIITNWKELEAATGDKIKGMIVEVYNKIYSFIQILQYYHNR
jgi:hypothetical protein